MVFRVRTSNFQVLSMSSMSIVYYFSSYQQYLFIHASSRSRSSLEKLEVLAWLDAFLPHYAGSSIFFGLYCYSPLFVVSPNVCSLWFNLWALKPKIKVIINVTAQNFSVRFDLSSFLGLDLTQTRWYNFSPWSLTTKAEDFTMSVL